MAEVRNMHGIIIDPSGADVRQALKPDPHPWVAAFDHEAHAYPEAWVVGGAILRRLVPGGREPRDLDVQFEGSEARAEELQVRLRARGVPANVRALESPGVRDMMGFAAALAAILSMQN